MLRRAAGVGILLFAVLCMPRTSEAGLLEFIWDLSGPQIVNVGFGCNFDMKFKKQDCGTKLFGASPFSTQETKLKELKATDDKATWDAARDKTPRVLFL